MRASTVIWALVGALFLAGAATLVFQNRRLIFENCPTRVAAAFTPDPNNDKALLVYGWSETEVRKMLADFATMYELNNGFSYRIRAQGQQLQVAFPEDIEPGLFAFLVNYVRYPKNVESGERKVESIGVTTLSPDFGLPTPALAGKRAVIYVPVGDKEFDRVFVRVDGKTFENSFAATCWQVVSDAQMPAEASAAVLTNRAE